MDFLTDALMYLVVYYLFFRLLWLILKYELFPILWPLVYPSLVFLLAFYGWLKELYEKRRK